MKALLLSCVVVVIAGAALAGAAQTFRSSAEAVRLDVFVTDGRKPIAGLAANDFDVKDLGALQQVRVEPVSGDIDVILTLDVSGSLSVSALAALKTAARQVIALLVPTDRVQIVTFNHLVSPASRFDNPQAVSLAALDDLKPGGGTALRDAVFASLLSVPPPTEGRRTLQLVLSDGDDSVSWLSADQVLTALRRSSVVVYSLMPAYPQRTLDSNFLRDAARDTGGRTLKVDQPEDTAAVFRQVFDEFRQRYVITYMPANGAKGWHPITVSVKGRRGAAVFARSGYFKDE